MAVGPDLHAPAAWVAALVREGDLAPAVVDLAGAAKQALERLYGDDELEEALATLSGLASVWRRRLEEVLLLPQPIEEEAASAAPIDPSLKLATRKLSALHEAAAGRWAGHPRLPRSERLGDGQDVWTARVAIGRRQREKVSTQTLWPEAARLPVLRRMRALLASLRLRPTVTLFARARSRPEQVAELLATLELTRRGRVRLVQWRPYGRVRLLRRSR